MPTYFEQREKIIQAYFRDDIKPMDPNFCFCGTLCNNTTNWHRLTYVRHYDSHGYIGREFVKMEAALLNKLDLTEETEYAGTEYEEKLFIGMCAALEVLKEIHRSRGEDVDTELAIPFTKRNLQKA